MQILPGSPYPLGATPDGEGTGVNFALFSEHAERVELCLYDGRRGNRELARVELPEYTNEIWHGLVPNVPAGQRDGYLVYGPYEPENGHRFNPAKLLLDPYARAIDSTVKWHDAVFGYPLGSGAEADLHPDPRDSGPPMPKSVVVDTSFDWGDDRAPHIPWHRSVIYETHVKGMTARHPGVPTNLRGKYAGLTCPPVLDHLRRLGITAVELMPVHQSQDEPRFYTDFTGTGNTLNAQNPRTLQLIMDSLRYWVLEMHVDGFRFDLASALARELHDVDRLGSFFDIIQQDPVLQGVKLIAEPWDVGEGGYQVGNFPPNWSEWNGKYRDTVRDYWRGDDETLAEFGQRLTGSSDLCEQGGRRPWASINFVTAHDGFTLNDLVSYNEKHNEANGEDNRDGESHNRSWNCGVEGPTDHPDVLACRARQRRNFLATLLLSQGIPMLLGGDEMGRTQQGNNNAYCLDNKVSWFDWEHVDDDLTEFTRQLSALRRAHPVFRRRGWFQGRPIRGKGVSDLAWFKPDGDEMSDEDWDVGYAKSLGVFLNGQELSEVNARGGRVRDDSFLLWGPCWIRLIDTATGSVSPGGPPLNAGAAAFVEARSLLVLQRVD